MQKDRGSFRAEPPSVGREGGEGWKTQQKPLVRSGQQWLVCGSSCWPQGCPLLPTSPPDPLSPSSHCLLFPLGCLPPPARIPAPWPFLWQVKQILMCNPGLLGSPSSAPSGCPGLNSSQLRSPPASSALPELLGKPPGFQQGSAKPGGIQAGLCVARGGIQPPHVSFCCAGSQWESRLCYVCHVSYAAWGGRGWV